MFSRREPQVLLQYLLPSVAFASQEAPKNASALAEVRTGSEN